MITSPAPLTILLARDPGGLTLPGTRGALRVTRDPARALEARRLLVLAQATYLAAVAQPASAANRAHRLVGLLVREDVSPRWVPQMMREAGLGLSERVHSHADDAVPQRVLTAHRMGAAAESIADATFVEETLVLLGCDFARHRIPVAAVPALRRLGKRERGAFAIADDGAYLHWPVPDLHLTLDTLLAAIDPTRDRANRLQALQADRAFGAAVRTLRRSRGLTQDAVVGISPRQLRRIEGGGAGSMLKDRVLEALAEAHGVTPDAYLEQLAEVVGRAG